MNTHRRLLLLIVGAIALALATVVSCTSTTTTPESTVEPTPVSISVYIAEVDRVLDFIDDTLEVAAAASQSLAENQISMEEYREMAVAGKQNLETAEESMNEMAPPSGSSGPASFEEVHEYLLRGIEEYERAFDEMIKYGDDGRLSHIQEATNLIENYGHPYINVVETELRMLKKEFLE
jgi:hypothetical protein